MPKKNEDDLSGMVFVGFLLLGLAIGIYYNVVHIGVLAGLGLGFIAMALIKMRGR